MERGGDVLIAVGGALGEGDEDVAAPAWGLELDLERGGDVLIAVGEALGGGDEDVAAPNPCGRDQWCGFRSPALMGTGSQFWRGGTGQVAKAVKAQGGL
jgi:hypothetical protein